MDDDNPYELSVARLCGRLTTPDEKLVGVAIAVLQAHQVPSANLSIVLVDDNRIAELNNAHLEHTGPTDVISFDLRDDTSEPIDGEIVISVDTAEREAAKRSHSVEAEVCLYIVHGLLHLIGYDDLDEEQAAIMHAKEDEILTGLGYGTIYQERQP